MGHKIYFIFLLLLITINFSLAEGDDSGDLVTYEWIDFPYKSEYLDGTKSEGDVCGSRSEWDNCWALDTSFRAGHDCILNEIYWEATNQYGDSKRVFVKYEIRIDGEKIDSSEGNGYWYAKFSGDFWETHDEVTTYTVQTDIPLLSGIHTIEVIRLRLGSGEPNPFYWHSNAYVNSLTLSTTQKPYDAKKEWCELNPVFKWIEDATGDYAPCCGDDGELDTFYVGTVGVDFLACWNGAEESDVDKTKREWCELNPSFIWIEDATGTNGNCCGDDDSEDFGNSTHHCFDGVYLDESKTACLDAEYIWVEKATGDYAPCCGDDHFENFSNSTHKCENGRFSYLSEPDETQIICESYGFTWVEGATGDYAPCCGDEGELDDFETSNYKCENGVLTALEICGDDICGANETSETCCKDCGCPDDYVCQDNTCIEELEECVQECSFIDGGICCSGLAIDDNKCIKCDGNIQSSDCEGNGLCKSTCGADSQCNNKIPGTNNCDNNCNYIGVIDQDSSESVCQYTWIGDKCCGDDELEDDYIFSDGMCLNGISYPCGVEDDICPEDFNATCLTEDIDCARARPAFLDIEIILPKEIYEPEESLDFQINITNYGDESAESIIRYQILKDSKPITEKQESKIIEKEEAIFPELTLPKELEPAEYSLYIDLSYDNKTITQEIPIYIQTLCVDIIPKELYIISNEERVIKIRIKNTCDFPLYNYTVNIIEFEYSTEFPNITKHKDIPLIAARLEEGDHTINIISKFNKGATKNMIRIRSTSSQTISSQINTLLSEINTKIETAKMQIGTLISEKEKTELLEDLNSVKKLKSNAEIESAARAYTEAQISLFLADDLIKDFNANLASKLSEQYQFYALIGVVAIGMIVGIVIVVMVVKKKFKFERKEKEEKEEEYEWK